MASGFENEIIEKEYRSPVPLGKRVPPENGAILVLLAF